MFNSFSILVLQLKRNNEGLKTKLAAIKRHVILREEAENNLYYFNKILDVFTFFFSLVLGFLTLEKILK